MPWANQPSEQPTDFTYDNWSQHLAPAFRAALQNIYGRGMDISSEAPWQVLDQAFPRAGSAQLRQGHDADLMDAARMFMSGQTPQKPEMRERAPLWSDDPSESSGGVAGGTDAMSPSSAIGAVSGYTGPATSIFGSVMGGPFSGIPSAGLAGLTALASGRAGVPGFSLDISNPISRGLESAFPLSQKGSEGKMESAVPVSPSFFNTAFTTPANLQAAIVGAINQGNTVSDNALEGGITPSQAQADAISSALQALAQGLPTVSPGMGMNSGTAPGQASQHGSESFAMNALGPSLRGFSETSNLSEGGKLGEGGRLSTPAVDPDVNFDFDPSTNAPPADDGTSGPAGPAGSGPAGGGAPGGTSGGTSTSGSGDAFKKGGVVRDTHKGFARKKGSHVVPIDAHEDEFVVNANASRAARPQLEALNSLIPGDAKREDIADLVKRAAKYFDVA